MTACIEDDAGWAAYDRLKNAGAVCCRSMRDQLDAVQRDRAELLEALQHIASFTAYVDCDNCNEMNVVARAAIAKAAGDAK